MKQRYCSFDVLAQRFPDIRVLIQASCSISCSEYDVSESLGFKPRFSPHFSMLS